MRDGSPWFSHTLNDDSLRSGKIPLARDINIKGDHKYRLGGIGEAELYIRDGAIFGMYEPLAISGAEVGERLLVLIDLKTNEIVCRFCEGELPEPTGIGVIRTAVQTEQQTQRLERFGKSTGHLNTEEVQLKITPSNNDFEWEHYDSLD